MPEETYALLVDDEVHIETATFLPNIKVPWAHAKSSGEAKGIITKRGMPTFISFDYSLKDQDNSIKFLNWLVTEYWDSNTNSPPVPKYQVHNGTKEQKDKIDSVMKSWEEYSH